MMSLYVQFDKYIFKICSIFAALVADVEIDGPLVYSVQKKSLNL